MYPNLKAEMARLKITQKELAEFLDIDETTLSAKLSGKSDFTFGQCLAIKRFLNVDIPLETLFVKSEV